MQIRYLIESPSLDKIYSFFFKVKSNNFSRLALALLGVATSVLISSVNSDAKDMTNRLGVGYKNQFAVDNLPGGVAAQYYPSADIGFSAALGVDTQQNMSKFGFMGKVYRIIFTEENMNFYMGAGAGLISNQTTAANTDSGFELNGFVGGEFFLHGLDSLGFTFEGGVGISSMSSGVRFRTFGDSPLRGGIIFYF